jgi:hypothetical protein
MTLEELFQSAAGGCQTPECRHEHANAMYLHARCHPQAGTFAVVDGRTLRIECAKCKKVVVVIEADPPAVSKS